ncbi:MAG: polysaccharide biosynthesis C-terminal domain-containing protein, partial [Eubacterium sp.]|nr:polysaccharide biosynthesis C-terminal domain-containing protein [Eubacterium sp.]
MKLSKERGIDFSQGQVWRNIVAQAVPLTVAQLVHLLYNVVDRVYIGHMGEGSSLALTGIGLTFPVVTLIMAFAALFGIGGVPLFSMARGADERGKAGRILGNSLSLILISSAALTVLGYAFRRPILFAFGASEESYVFAKAYLDIYLLGTAFSMIATGMNGYINAQGFPRAGMLSIVIGAVVNIILDPLFIFGLHLGVRGAAAATVISQALSAAWVLRFLTGKRAVEPFMIKNMKPDRRICFEITKLGTANFIMQGTNC